MSDRKNRCPISITNTNEIIGKNAPKIIFGVAIISRRNARHRLIPIFLIKREWFEWIVLKNKIKNSIPMGKQEYSNLSENA